MTRPTRDEALVSTAEIWALRSTCERLHVGALAHRDGRILTTGYNGAAANLPHCHHEEWHPGEDVPLPFGIRRQIDNLSSKYDSDSVAGLLRNHLYFDGHKLVSVSDPKDAPGCSRAVHAEQNAIAFAARHGVGLEGSDMVVTHQPCLSCAMSIINAGIQSVLYIHTYRLRDGINLLSEAGVQVDQWG